MMFENTHELSASLLPRPDRRNRWVGLGLALSLVFSIAAADTARADEPDQQFADLDSCVLVNGEVIRDCRIGYRTYGEMNADRSNVVLWPSWYNGQTYDIDPFIAYGAIDTSTYFVVTIDSLGDGVSSSPSNGRGSQKGVRFPKFTITDMVDAEYRVVTEVLGLSHIHAVVGVSMGGMQAYAWAVRYPHFVDTVIPIEGTPWLTANDLLTWSIMRGSIVNDPAYQRGHYRREPQLNLANEVDQMFAYTPSYRARETAVADFPAFLGAVHTMPTIGANNRVWQIDAILSLNVLNGANPQILQTMSLPNMLIIKSRSDHTVNPEPSIEWANLTNSEILVLENDCGHMASVCDFEAVATAMYFKLAE